MNPTYEELAELCRRALLALDEDEFPQLREDLRNALEELACAHY